MSFRFHLSDNNSSELLLTSSSDKHYEPLYSYTGYTHTHLLSCLNPSNLDMSLELMRLAHGIRPTIKNGITIREASEDRTMISKNNDGKSNY